MEMDLPCIKANVINVQLKTNYLWRPSEVLGTGDDRQVGIAIVFGEIKVI